MRSKPRRFVRSHTDYYGRWLSAYSVGYVILSKSIRPTVTKAITRPFTLVSGYAQQSYILISLSQCFTTELIQKAIIMRIMRNEKFDYNKMTLDIEMLLRNALQYSLFTGSIHILTGQVKIQPIRIWRRLKGKQFQPQSTLSSSCSPFTKKSVKVGIYDEIKINQYNQFLIFGLSVLAKHSLLHKQTFPNECIMIYCNYN